MIPSLPLRVLTRGAAKVERNRAARLTLTLVTNTMTPARTLYLVFRGLALCVALLLGFFIVSAVVWVPFYAGEGYTLQFQDRILGLIGDCLFFAAILVPYRWTIAKPYYQFRLGLIILAAAWVLWVDTRAFSAGLTRERFPPSSWLAVIVALVLIITLYMRRARHLIGAAKLE